MLNITKGGVYGMPNRGSQRKNEMTIAELERMTPEEIDKSFDEIPEPNQLPINTGEGSLKKIFSDFSNQTVSQEEREELQKKLVALA